MAVPLVAADPIPAKLEKYEQELQAARQGRSLELSDGEIRRALRVEHEAMWPEIVSGDKNLKRSHFIENSNDFEYEEIRPKIRRLIRFKLDEKNAIEKLELCRMAQNGSRSGATTATPYARPIATQLKLTAQKPVIWSPAKAKSCTPAEFMQQLRKFATRTLQYRLDTVEGYANYMALIRDSLTSETLVSVDVQWDAWETKNPAAQPTDALIQAWLELMLTEHTSARQLRAEYKARKQSDSSLSGLNNFIRETKKSLQRLSETGNLPTLFDQKCDFYENMHPKIKESKVKEFGRIDVLESSDSFDSYIEQLQIVAVEELQHISTPPKSVEGEHKGKFSRWNKNKGGKKHSNKDAIAALVATARKAGMAKGDQTKLTAAINAIYSPKGGGKDGKGGKGGKGKGGKGGKGDAEEKGGYKGHKILPPCNICGRRHGTAKCWQDPSRPESEIPSHVKRVTGEALAQLKAANLQELVRRESGK